MILSSYYKYETLFNMIKVLSDLRIASRQTNWLHVNDVYVADNDSSIKIIRRK